MSVLNLRQDDHFGEEDFVTLIIEAYKLFPLLRGHGPSAKDKSSED